MDDIRNAFVVLDTLLLVISRYDIKRTIFSEFIISNKDNLKNIYCYMNIQNGITLPICNQQNTVNEKNIQFYINFMILKIMTIMLTYDYNSLIYHISEIKKDEKFQKNLVLSNLQIDSIINDIIDYYNEHNDIITTEIIKDKKIFTFKYKIIGVNYIQKLINVAIIDFKVLRDFYNKNYKKMQNVESFKKEMISYFKQITIQPYLKEKDEQISIELLHVEDLDKSLINLYEEIHPEGIKDRVCREGKEDKQKYTWKYTKKYCKKREQQQSTSSI